MPQGLLDELAGRPSDSVDPAIKAETDRRTLATMMKAERKLGRVPEEQPHSNPGYVISTDPGAEGADQRSDLLDARAEVMEQWGRYLHGKGA